MARRLPAKVLLDLSNVSIYQQMGEKVKQAVTVATRTTKSEISPSALFSSLLTGKDEYKFGDITKSIGSLQKLSKGKQQSIVMDNQKGEKETPFDACFPGCVTGHACPHQSRAVIYPTTRQDVVMFTAGRWSLISYFDSRANRRRGL